MTEARTMPELLRTAADRFADGTAIVDGAVRVTYTELADQVRTAARAYLASGVRPGDRIAIWAPNRAEFVAALLGAEYVGIAVVPLNTRFRGHEAREILARSRAVALVVADGFLGADYLGMLRTAAADTVDASGAGPVPGLPHLRLVVELGEPRSGTVSWADLLAAAERVPASAVEDAAGGVTPETVCDVLFTSGTTGAPKGVMSSHRQTLSVAAVWARGASLTPDDRYAVVNPFFHSFGYKAGIIAAMTAGTTIYPVATFDPEALLGLIERERITVLPGAPTIFTTLINHPKRETYDLSSLRFAIAGAASVPENLFQQMRDVLGFDTVAQAYGLTECVVATQSRPNEDPAHIAGTTGPAVPGLEIRIAGPEDEVQIRGANVMLGYFEDPDATAAAIDPDGWLHTGDQGRLDEHGCLTITGRIKDMFIVGGFNVYPAEVENVLADHPAVAEAAVIGVPDERLGSVGRAYVTLRPGATLDEDAVLAHCRERLANFKVPRSLVVLDELPRNAAGKILKRVLADKP
ncbi:FadD3 family acyl-CoA ligase [Cryptosporangium aurantiacum]|uniref:Acyl-CoA synthetase (AMP-forming)/AMP-acid ligase II n=1 Tax=Cryptosporangium aurantiacum TaxID=134849 RepID=A0A1M7RC41_9ACTN|nr:FadD3 family acyl-CoA ligase [Cryptosporangium aurantiacum]SHN43702.1 Acyl-CoA synthetase (AMP-forming)/AMP-acid ligase II [Cryptosporangium aurantiacum]